MKLFQFKNPSISIQNRIILGFGVICFFMMGIGLISLWGIVKVADFSNELLEISEESDWQIDINTSVVEIQSYVLRYMFQGHNTARKSALEKMSALMERLDLAENRSGVLSDAHPIIKRCRDQLNLYKETFDQAITERQIQIDLTRVQLPRTLNELESNLIQYYDQPKVSDTSEYAVNDLIKFNNSIHAYFESFDYRNVNDARETLGQLRKKHKEQHADPEANAYMISISNGFDLLEKDSQRAVQATRAYLFLINVVMSGHAAEMLYQADHLRQFSEQHKNSIITELSQTTDRIAVTIILIIAITVIAGIVYAFFTAIKISRPIEEISKTLVKLSDGEEVDNIPGIDKLDEIGSLAKSAEVFRQRNAETVNLLENSERLTGELISNKKKLEASNLEMEQFVYTVSHDLKSPIVTSMGFINIIHDLAENGQFEEAIAKLDRVEKAVNRMGELINDLLALSRAGNAEESIISIDSGATLDELIDSMINEIESAGFVIRLNGPFPQISANKSRFMQVMGNLISNALKYGKESSSELSRIEIGCEKNDAGDQYIFTVRDFGIGIPEEFHEKIFGLFSRLGSGTGTGIGLAIVRKLVRLYGGEAWTTCPENGSGSLFHVSFPSDSQKTVSNLNC